MKKILKILIIIILIYVYAYICNIESIPENIVLFEGEKINVKTTSGLTLNNHNNYKTALTSNNLNKKIINETGINKLELNLFGKIAVKNINVSVIPKTKVIPLGTAIGMKLYTKGVLVVGMTQIDNENDEKEKPYENSGIEEGDSIISINGKNITNTNELIEQVNNSDGKLLEIKYMKNNTVLETNITPVKTKNEYKIGLWVRDTTAGVGTATFYEPSTNIFMSLGHGIVDIDTNEIVNISNGELITANILSIVKGVKGTPGEIRGTINKGNSIGQVYKNTNFGVFGKLKNQQYLEINNQNEVEVASREEIKEGKAKIICQLDNENPKEYEIEIQKIYKNNNEDNKSMLIKILDEKLLEKTGGIIQGMSGAPILQNNKFIGAITNVLVNDPTQGYAIFGDLMIKKIRNI